MPWQEVSSIIIHESLQNGLGFGLQAEADLAVALFQALREELLLAVRKNALRHPVLVGVITPYREQVTCIKQSLDSVLGPDLAKEVRSASSLSSCSPMKIGIALSRIRMALHIKSPANKSCSVSMSWPRSWTLLCQSDVYLKLIAFMLQLAFA